MKYNIQVYEGEINGYGEKEGLPTEKAQRERMVSTRTPRGFPDLISENFESKLSFKTQTSIIPFFPINPKYPQRKCLVKKCIQVC